MADDDDDPNGQNPDFLNSMHDMFDMDKDAVDALLEKLDADALEALTDAIAKRDKPAAEQVIAQAHTDEEVNALFRGEHLDDVQKQKKRTRLKNDGKMQFAIGDDVLVNIKDKHGNVVKSVSGTVSNPNGPEGTNTVVVKIEGKPTMVQAHDLDKLDENIIGMLGMPNLGRIQQLAGIQAQGIPPQGEIMQQVIPELTEPEALPDPEPAPDDPLGQAMAAFETLEAALPNIILADLKCVRERLTALQASLNESITPKGFGRVRKS
jgi:hypothetical protein